MSTADKIAIASLAVAAVSMILALLSVILSAFADSVHKRRLRVGAAVAGIVMVVTTFIGLPILFLPHSKSEGPVTAPTTTPSTSTTPPATSTAEPTGSESELPSSGDPIPVPLLGFDAPEGTIAGQSGDAYIDVGDVTLDGVPAEHAMGAACHVLCHPQATATIEVNLGRKYSHLLARVGATDLSPSTDEAVDIEVLALDGGTQRSVYHQSYRQGQAEDVDLVVTDMPRLRFVFRGSLGRVFGGVGDPVVTE